MKVIAFRAAHNKPGKHDVTGAFAPECQLFMQCHGGQPEDIVVIDNSRSESACRQETLDALNLYAGRNLEAVAFFCHGWPNGMELGFDKRNVDKLACAIYDACERTNIQVPLYLCWTGEGGDKGATSFADALRDELCGKGAPHCRVMAHTYKGHTTMNPHIRFFDGMGSSVGGVGGYDVVAGPKEVRKKLIDALRGKTPGLEDFRFKFPFMSVGEIVEQLTGTALTPAPLVSNGTTPTASELFKVTDGVALIRTLPRFRSTGRKIPKGTMVRIAETREDYVHVLGIDGRDYRWTLRSNLAARPTVLPALTPQGESPAYSLGSPVTPRPPVLAPEPDVKTVFDKDSRLRTPPPQLALTRKKIPRFTSVRILDTHRDCVRVVTLDGRELGWTKSSNLTKFHKDNAEFLAAKLAPSQTLSIEGLSNKSAVIAKIYNRLGGLLSTLSDNLQINPAAALAVWMVESGGRRHVDKHAVIRFEVHHFHRRWGRRNEELFNKHFRFGGHAGVTGESFRNHAFRTNARQSFHDSHASQKTEYTVLDFATTLSDAETARSCISIGGPQILISHYDRLGYPRPSEMYDAFQNSERAQILGFFDFCEGSDRRGGMIKSLRRKEFEAFASVYNGSGKPKIYASRIEEAFEVGERLLRG